jgi:hypothetical protein
MKQIPCERSFIRNNKSDSTWQEENDWISCIWRQTLLTQKDTLLPKQFLVISDICELNCCYKYTILQWTWSDRLCGLVVRVPGYRFRGPGSIPVATRFSETWWVWNGVHSASWVQLMSYLEEKVAAPVQKAENTAVGIRHADHMALSSRKSWH